VTGRGGGSGGCRSQRPSANQRCIVRTEGTVASSAAWRARRSAMTARGGSPSAKRRSASIRSRGQL
jgi:hypothetical protein